MRYCVLLVLVGCAEASAPREIRLGPGCWTVNRVPVAAGVVLVKQHYPLCPDSLPEGQAFWHWDTTYVAGH